MPETPVETRIKSTKEMIQIFSQNVALRTKYEKELVQLEKRRSDIKNASNNIIMYLGIGH